MLSLDAVACWISNSQAPTTMKRKAASSIERAELDACAPAEGNQAPEDAEIR